MSDSKKDETLRILRKFERVLRMIRASTDPNVSTAVVEAFLAVAIKEDQNTGEVADGIGLRVSTASRYLLDLGKHNRRLEPGYKVVDSRPDPKDRRATIHKLSPKGRMLVREIVETLRD